MKPKTEATTTPLASDNPAKLRVRIPHQNGFVLLVLEEIVYCEADGPLTKFYLHNKTCLTAGRNLGVYAKLLSEHGFMRIHHRHLINLEYLVRYDNQHRSVTLSTGTALSISNQKVPQLLEFVRAISL